MYSNLRLRKHVHLSPETYEQNNAVFITICTQYRRPLFGVIRDDSLELSPCGQIVSDNINQLINKYPGVQITHSVIMPNHIHLLISRIRTARGKIISLAQLISQFKGKCSKDCNIALWQRGYYDHVVRTEDERLKIIEYIQNNPRKWSLDQEYVKE